MPSNREGDFLGQSYLSTLTFGLPSGTRTFKTGTFENLPTLQPLNPLVEVDQHELPTIFTKEDAQLGQQKSSDSAENLRLTRAKTALAQRQLKLRENLEREKIQRKKDLVQQSASGQIGGGDTLEINKCFYCFSKNLVTSKEFGMVCTDCGLAQQEGNIEAAGGFNDHRELIKDENKNFLETRVGGEIIIP